jgi:hypothetical protein
VPRMRKVCKPNLHAQHVTYVAAARQQAIVVLVQVSVLSGTGAWSSSLTLSCTFSHLEASHDKLIWIFDVAPAARSKAYSATNALDAQLVHTPQCTATIRLRLAACVTAHCRCVLHELKLLDEPCAHASICDA